MLSIRNSILLKAAIAVRCIFASVHNIGDQQVELGERGGSEKVTTTEVHPLLLPLHCIFCCINVTSPVSTADRSLDNR